MYDSGAGIAIGLKNKIRKYEKIILKLIDKEELDGKEQQIIAELKGGA